MSFLLLDYQNLIVLFDKHLMFISGEYFKLENIEYF